MYSGGGVVKEPGTMRQRATSPANARPRRPTRDLANQRVTSSTDARPGRPTRDLGGQRTTRLTPRYNLQNAVRLYPRQRASSPDNAPQAPTTRLKPRQRASSPRRRSPSLDYEISAWTTCGRPMVAPSSTSPSAGAIDAERTRPEA
ncbi:hypothetical protein BD626DRAFT_507124 [Schizophyllum amplum]|uniref:Uncharacterized protein n=1 Tax=Schizophyllum amplum TaxID=97359 RepID=A0A550C4N6_9AGAR|nr:hypothetical protein BD626DRAFT_507124 [Auriculariopsis ampla]